LVSVIFSIVSLFSITLILAFIFNIFLRLDLGLSSLIYFLGF
jgi:hypothetical protein